MPLPNSGVGGTFTSGTGSGNAQPAQGAGALARGETLFGLAPDQMAGMAAAVARPAPVVQPQPSAAPPRTVPVVSASPRPEPAPPQAASPGGVMTADSPVPNRTLVGVMPRDMVRALAGGGREQPPQQQSAQHPQQPAVHQQPVHQQPVHQQPVRQQPQQPLRPQQPAPLPQHTAPAVAYGKSTSPVHGQGQQGHAPHQQHVIAQPAPQPPHRPPSTPPPAFEPNRVVSAGGAGPGAAGPSRPAPGPRTMFEPATANMPQYMPQRPAAPGPRTMLEAPAGGIPDQGTVRSAAPTYDPEPDAMDEAFAANAPGQARTHLGVAIPGIAPLRASMDVGSPPARPKRMLEETMLQPDSLSTPPVTTRAVMPRGAYVLLGSGLVLLVAAVAFALLWQGKKPLEVAVGADPAGRDRLEIVCQDCPDGTIVSLDSISGEIAGQRTELTLPEPLPLGESRVSFGVQRPGAEKPRAVEMTLPPVEYRIRPDTSTLAGDQPRLTLEITAIPGSKVEIARQLVALDPTGRGEIAVDLTGQLNGPATEVVSIEQAIAYVIVPPSGKVYEGQLTVKIGVTPLLLEAPGVDTITDLERFMLAGRTTRGAELWVAGTTISVDGSGRFAQLMSIDSVGETRVTVRATEPGLAPRFASFRLQRVENLENELAARRPKALPLATVARNIADHVGSTVVVTGRIEEAKADGHRSLIILQSEGDCGGRSCLSRLVYGGLKKLERGQTITAIGRLQGTVGAPGAEGAEVPDVDVSLLSL